MNIGYVDTSALLAIIFQESQGTSVLRRLESFDLLLSADLLHAELQAAYQRERLDREPTLPVTVGGIIPDRPLTEEVRRVFATGALRGADGWHLAVALYLAPEPSEITFITLDRRQGDAAHRLGFTV